MSFAGFKKTLDRTTTSLMQKAGAMDKTIDKQFEEEERHFKSLINKAEGFYKESKLYLDAARSMSVSQQRISESVTAFYDETSTLGLCGLKFKDAMTQLDTVNRPEFDKIYRETLFDPLGRYISLFPNITEAIKRRDNKLLDYDSLRAKVKKLVDKPDSDTTKLPRAEAQLAQAKEVYETLNSKLLDDMPRMIKLRTHFLDPSFEALIKTQYTYYYQSLQTLQPLSKYFDAGTDPELRVQSVLQQMKDLTIVRAGLEKK